MKREAGTREEGRGKREEGRGKRKREEGSWKRSVAMVAGQDAEICDVCGSSNIVAFKCKLICQNCGTILKTCSDLSEFTPRSEIP